MEQCINGGRPRRLEEASPYFSTVFNYRAEAFWKRPRFYDLARLPLGKLPSLPSLTNKYKGYTYKSK
jgi:hypothetical protein